MCYISTCERGEYKIKKQKNKNKVILLATAIAVGTSGAYVAYATNEEDIIGEEEKVFFTEEPEGMLLDATEGQEQVRNVKLKQLQEERRIAEKEAEEERKRVEAEEERKRVEAEEAERERKRVEAKKVEEEKVTTKNEAKPATSSKKPETQSGNSLGTFEATAYGPDCYGCSGVTANGTDIRNGNIYTSEGYRVIAADPNVIPMNTIVRLTYSSGSTEMAKVSDTGGAIKGRIIDIAHTSEAQAKPFGRQQVQIEIIN